MDIRGRGCPLKLELTDTDMQNIDFGVTKGHIGALQGSLEEFYQGSCESYVCVCVAVC